MATQEERKTDGFRLRRPIIQKVVLPKSAVSIAARDSHGMDSTATDVSTEHAGWKSVTGARGYAGLMTASPAVAGGGKRSTKTVVIDADALPLPEQFTGFLLCSVRSGTA